MPAVPAEILDFLQAQKHRHGELFVKPSVDKVLTWVGTTARPGTLLDVKPFALSGLELAAEGKELSVRLAGELPRAPYRGECISVSVTNYARMRGYQIRSYDLHIPDLVHLLYEQHGPEVVIHGRLLYTVHNSPNSLTVFEQIPIDQVRGDLAGVRFALLGVGQRASISPRFIFHYEVRDGRLLLFRGEGYPHKTFLNLQVNPREQHLALDLDRYAGYALGGPVELVTALEEPLAHAKVVAGFTTRGWGPPKLVYRITVEAWSPVGP
jgi:hypothetical protein